MLDGKIRFIARQCRKAGCKVSAINNYVIIVTKDPFNGTVVFRKGNHGHFCCPGFDATASRKMAATLGRQYGIQVNQVAFM